MIDVVKIGGGKGVAMDVILGDAAHLIAEGAKIIIVHGASEEIRALGERLGEPPRYFTSPDGMTSRHTNPAALDVALMAFDRVNRQIVAKLRGMGVVAVGLSAMDGGLVTARRKTSLRSICHGRVCLIHDDYSARITAVDSRAIDALLGSGITPVVSPPAFDPIDGPVNVDADRLAAALAAALAPSDLYLMTNVPGLLRYADDPLSLVPVVYEGDIERAMTSARGRMRLKVLAAKEALRGGVRRVVIADGNAAAPIRAAAQGGGTRVCRGSAASALEASQLGR